MGKHQRDPEYRRLPRAWPQYCPKPTERVLAVMTGDGRLLTEYGEYLDRPPTWEEFTRLLFSYNLLVYVGGVDSALQEYWPEVFAELPEQPGHRRGHKTELHYSDTRSELCGLSVQRYAKNASGKYTPQVRKITVSSCWGRAIEPELLTDLRYMFDLLETGVIATPGAVGYATMARAWSGKTAVEMPRHYRPPLKLIQELEEHAIGSRREAYRPEDIYDEAYELDCTNGYAAQCGDLPCGHAIYLFNATDECWDNPNPHFWTWWGHVVVRIYDEGLAPGDLAPFATRGLDGQLDWPTAAGLYHTYLWSFEAEEIRKRSLAGDPIEVLGVVDAWAWTDHTTQLAPWQQYMDAARREAKQSSKARSALVKICIVAGIGRMGLPYTSHRITAQDGEGRVYLSGAGLPDQALYIEETAADPGTPKHWQCYILSRMAFRIYQEARRCYLEGIPVVAVNVDSLITTKPPYWGSHPDYARIGEFKLNKLGTWVACPGPGMVLNPDQQDIRIPGMTQLERERAMRLHRPGERKIHRRGEKPNQQEQARLAFRDASHAAALRLRDYILKVG